MKKICTLLTALLLALCLNACGAEDPPPSAGEAAPVEETPEVHSLSAGGNVVEHEEAVYCGNTVTTVTGADGTSFSFWGNDSIALTDLLRWLKYSEDVCRCQPEYTVDTEFNEGYGLSLAEGYARYDGSQTALTEEQVELVREIIGRQSGGGEADRP